MITIKCPRCLLEFTGFPAMSRTDNKTEICSDCGVAEAMDDLAGIPLRKIFATEGPSLADRLNSIHCLIQDIEFSGLSDAFTEDEYELMYSGLEEARDFFEKEGM